MAHYQTQCMYIHHAVTNNTRTHIEILKNNLKSYPNKVAVYSSTKYQISSFLILFLSNLSVSTMICNLWTQTMIWNPWNLYSILVSWQQTIYWISFLPMMNPM